MVCIHYSDEHCNCFISHISEKNVSHSMLLASLLNFRHDLGGLRVYSKGEVWKMTFISKKCEGRTIFKGSAEVPSHWSLPDLWYDGISTFSESCYPSALPAILQVVGRVEFGQRQRELTCWWALSGRSCSIFKAQCTRMRYWYFPKRTLSTRPHQGPAVSRHCHGYDEHIP